MQHCTRQHCTRGPNIRGKLPGSCVCLPARLPSRLRPLSALPLCVAAPGRYNTETVSPEVLAQMKAAMQESSSSAASHSFLLDDDSAIPFTHADVERMVDDKVGSDPLKTEGWVWE